MKSAVYLLSALIVIVSGIAFIMGDDLAAIVLILQSMWLRDAARGMR